MISETQPPRRVAIDLPAIAAVATSYVDWAVIFAGAILALAFSSLLTSFGATLGLSLSSPYRGEGVSEAWLAIAAGIWFAWVMVSGFGAGGYLAGRMRRHAGDATPDEVSLRDGAHGLLVWATGVFAGTVIAAGGASGLVNAGASAVGSTTEIAADIGSSDYFANVLLRRSAQNAAPSVTSTAPALMADGDAPPVPARQQPPVAGPTATVDPAVQREIVGILARSATIGALMDRDRDYLVQLVAANSTLHADAARMRVDEVTAEIDAARQAAINAVEQARVAGVVLGFIAAATLLIGAIAAFFAAVTGGKHRDDGLGLDVLTMRR